MSPVLSHPVPTPPPHPGGPQDFEHAECEHIAPEPITVHSDGYVYVEPPLLSAGPASRGT